LRFFAALLRAGVLASALTLAQSASAQAAAASGEPVNGIKCESMEGSVFHIHQHLSIYAHGKAVLVPALIGIPLMGNCLYWVHTHTPDGLIHVESPIYRDFYLGDFFDVWGQPLSRTNVAGVHLAQGQLRAYVNGRRFTENPRTIPLTLHADIVLEAGPPYFTPKPFTNWQGQ
jgi:hypothetical protein